MDKLYTFKAIILPWAMLERHYKTKSVHILELMNSATQVEWWASVGNLQEPL